MMEPIKKPDMEPIRQRAYEAKELLENAAFKWAALKLRQRWFQELLENGGGDVGAIRLIANINALENLASELQVCINDYKMAVKNA